MTGNIPCFSLELGFTGSKPLSWSPFHVMTEPPNWYAKSRRTRTASQQGDDGWKLVSSTSMVPPWRRCLKRWKNGENFGKCKPGWWLIVINHNSDLVGGIPKIRESQLGWWHSQYGKRKHVPNHQPVIRPGGTTYNNETIMIRLLI